MVATLFNNSNPQHIAMIEQLFHVLFPGIQLTCLLIYLLTHSHTGQPYSRLSDTWKQAGFQKNDPILDLKATGTLAVKCMIYFGSNKVHPLLTYLLTYLLTHLLTQVQKMSGNGGCQQGKHKNELSLCHSVCQPHVASD
jgi:hypothetical protein